MATLGMRGTGSFPADHRPENYREKYLMLAVSYTHLTLPTKA